MIWILRLQWFMYLFIMDDFNLFTFKRRMALKKISFIWQRFSLFSSSKWDFDSDFVSNKLKEIHSNTHTTHVTSISFDSSSSFSDWHQSQQQQQKTRTEEKREAKWGNEFIVPVSNLILFIVKYGQGRNIAKFSFAWVYK